MNICLLGLSGSGKTCYLYTATHVLARGVKVNGHTISATSSNRQQAIRLNKGIEQMASGIWPKTSMNSMAYPFDLKIDGKSVFPFTIYDYRGGMLNGLSDKEIGEQLSIDIARYGEHCQKLICFIYDKENFLSNPFGLISDLEKLSTEELSIRIFISPL